MSKKIEFDLNNLTRVVYNKIALWNNEEGTPEQKSKSLKFVSHEIIQSVLNEAFSKIDGVKTGIKTLKQPEKVDNGVLKKIFKKNNIYKKKL